MGTEGSVPTALDPLSHESIDMTPREPSPRPEAPLFFALLATLTAFELYASWLAYETLGEVAQLAWLLMTFLVGAGSLVFFFAGLRRAAIGVALLGAVILVPYQLSLQQRLLRLQGEVATMTTYLFEHKLEQGCFPEDLSGYTFRDPRLMEYFQLYEADEGRGGFVLVFYVGTPSTSHWFSPREGWGYYPD